MTQFTNVYKYLLKSDPIDHIRILGVIGTETDLRLSLMRVIFSNANNVYASVYDSLKTISQAHTNSKCPWPLTGMSAYGNELKWDLVKARR